MPSSSVLTIVDPAKSEKSRRERVEVPRDGHGGPTVFDPGFDRHKDPMAKLTTPSDRPAWFLELWSMSWTDTGCLNTGIWHCVTWMTNYLTNHPR
jgi:hypothetical protein